MKKFRAFFKHEDISSIEVEAENLADARNKAKATSPKFLKIIPANIFKLIGIEEII